MKSYQAHYWTVDGKPMLGGVTKSKSSRFDNIADARLRLWTAVEINADAGRAVTGQILEVRGRAEIVRHCGPTAQAVGFTCPDCKQVIS